MVKRATTNPWREVSIWLAVPLLVSLILLAPQAVLAILRLVAVIAGAGLVMTVIYLLVIATPPKVRRERRAAMRPVTRVAPPPLRALDRHERGRDEERRRAEAQR